MNEEQQKFSISLIPAEPRHDNLLFRIFKESRTDLTWINGISGEQKEAIMFQQYMSEKEQLNAVYPEAELNIIMFDNKPVGRIYINYGENTDRILEIGLLEDYRNKGIGSTVISKVMKNAIERGKSVSLQVAWFNQAAYRLYKKLGFQVVENNGITYKMKYIKE